MRNELFGIGIFLAIRVGSGQSDLRRHAASGTAPSPCWCGLTQNVGVRVALIKLDIVNHMVNRTGMGKMQAERAVEAVFESIKQALARGEHIEFRGFGVFDVRPRKTGIARNPRTGIEVPIPAGKAIRFRPGKGLKDLE